MKNMMDNIRDAIRERNNFTAIKIINENPEIINSLTPARGTLLHDAVRFGNEEIAEFLIDCGIDLKIESPASGMYGTAINCANTIGMARLLLRKGMQPETNIEDKLKNPIFRNLFMDNDIMFGFWYDTEMNMIEDTCKKQLLLNTVLSIIENKDNQIELLKYINSYNRRMDFLNEFKDKLYSILMDIINNYYYKDVYACSITYDSDLQCMCIVANTNNEIDKHKGSENYWYYKYYEEEWDIWNIEKEKTQNLSQQVIDNKYAKEMFPIFRTQIFEYCILVLRKIKENQKYPNWNFNFYVRDYFSEDEIKSINLFINGEESKEFIEHIKEFSS